MNVIGRECRNSVDRDERVRSLGNYCLVLKHILRSVPSGFRADGFAPNLIYSARFHGSRDEAWSTYCRDSRKTEGDIGMSELDAQ